MQGKPRHGNREEQMITRRQEKVNIPEERNKKCRERTYQNAVRREAKARTAFSMVLSS
jgi:hypothetical protein